MIMEPLISVIVPVYKVEQYLNKCIDSIINQTYPKLEIILVDDGSPDNCGIICDDYAKKDSRVIVIHKENGGLSDARNAGINEANGRYIGFVDSDDWIELDMYEKLLAAIAINDSDISICKFNIVRKTSDVFINNSNTKNELILDSTGALKIMYSQDLFDCSAWNKLYKRELFNDIKYPFGLFAEDLATTYKLFDKAFKITYIDEALYNYNVIGQSIMRSGFSERKLQELTSCEEILKFTEDKYPALVPYAKERIAATCRSLIFNIAESDYRNRKIQIKLRNTLRRNLKYYLKSKSKGSLAKLLTIICAISPEFLRILYIIKRKLKH
jgi:glycosyltransferase involved in cell wall biosynthesis